MLKKLYLHQFRNYSQVEIAFSPGVNWIYGKNAQGKTNILEAIYLLSTGRSFRTHKLSQLIQQGANFFYIEAEIEKAGVTQSLKLSFDGEVKKVEYNATSYNYFTPLLGILPHVLYAPEDLALIAGTPAHRRKLLDVHLAQIDPLYIHHLARYHKAMRHRNELLKAKSEIAIEPWEEAMAWSAAYILMQRNALIERIREPLLSKMKDISLGKDLLSIEYQTTLHGKTKEAYFDQFKKNRKKEIHVGTTLYGPHRDDLLLSIQDLSAKSYGSIGQQHSVAASLRLCLWQDLKRETQEIPLFSVDDFGAHLDATRQHQFHLELSQIKQIFLTSPSLHADIFPEKKILEIDSGKVFEVCSP